jgi:uncharacterized membrane protein
VSTHADDHGAVSAAATPTGTPQLGKHRIEALVDGIFAVAMTLLVIDLRLPEHAHLATSGQLRDALVELAPNLYSWLVSFVVLAIFWMANHRLYSHVRHVDGALLWSTILMLGGVSLLPFASAVNSTMASQLAQFVYSSVMIVIALGALLVSHHIYRHPELCAHPMDRATWRGATVRTGGLIVIAVLAVPLAGWLPGYANFAYLLIFALRPLANRLGRGEVQR